MGFVGQMQQQHAVYAKAHKQYLLYSRILCSAALVFAIVLFLMEIFAPDVASAAMEALADTLNPFDSGPIVDNDIGRKIVAFINLLLVVGLTTVGDLRTIAQRNLEVAARYIELADEARGKPEDALAALHEKRKELDVEVERRQLSMRNPLASGLSSLLFVSDYVPLTSDESELLLARSAMRSDDLEMGVAPPQGMFSQMISSVEKVTGLDIDGDGTVAGVSKPASADDTKAPATAAPGGATTSGNAKKRADDESSVADSGDDDEPPDDDEDDAKEPVKQKL